MGGGGGAKKKGFYSLSSLKERRLLLMVPLLKDQGGVSMNAKVKREREREMCSWWVATGQRESCCFSLLQCEGKEKKSI